MPRKNSVEISESRICNFEPRISLHAARFSTWSPRRQRTYAVRLTHSLATRTHVDTRDRSRSRSPAPPAANPTHFEDDAEKIKAFVGGLPWSVDDAGLRDAFADFNPDECVVMMDKFNGKSRGFGFVYFTTEKDREDAIEKLHDSEMEGRRISVRVSLPREQRGERRGGRGGGFRGGGGGRYGGGGGYGGGRDRYGGRGGGYGGGGGGGR